MSSLGNKEKEFENRDVNKYILEECAKFNLTENITNKEVNMYYEQLTSINDDNISVKDKKIYLYDYLVNDMIKDGEITQQEGKDFMKQIEKQEKNKSKERSR